MIDSKKLENFIKDGNSLKNQGKKQEAILSYKKALKIESDNSEIYNKIGITYSELDNFEEAILSYTKAIKFNSKYSIAYNNLGNALQFKGDLKLAETSYEKAIQIQPNFSLAYRNLSTVRKFKEGDAILMKMLNLNKNNNLSLEDKINLNYALGKAYNDLRSFKKAFTYFNKANNLNNNKIKYTIKNDENFFKIIKNLFSNNILPLTEKDIKKKYLIKHPIFILGMPRSGSTLVEQIISSHSGVYGAGELDILDRAVMMSRDSFGKRNK